MTERTCGLLGPFPGDEEQYRVGSSECRVCLEPEVPVCTLPCLRRIVGARSNLRRFVLAGSGGKQTGILGRLRNKRDRRHERRAEKGRVEAKRQWDERSREREGNAAGGKGFVPPSF